VVSSSVWRFIALHVNSWHLFSTKPVWT
jgi:hypothetical protein